jgi:endoglucanase
MRINYYRIEATTFARPTTAWEEIAHMGPGINLGNVFDAPDGEGMWWNGTIKPEIFDDFKSAGFKNVRLPVTWQKHIAETEPYAVDTKFMDMIAEVVNWATQL